MLLIRTVFTVLQHGLTGFVVAVSSFGFALGGLAFYSLKNKPAGTNVCAALAFGAMSVFYLVIFFLLGLHGFGKLGWAVPLLLTLTAFFFTGPGFFAAFLFSRPEKPAGRAYAIDMAGAAAGAGVSIVLLQILGREPTITLTLFALLSAFTFSLLNSDAAYKIPVLILAGIAAVAGGLQLRQPWRCENFAPTDEVHYYSDAMANVTWIKGGAEVARRNFNAKITPEESAQTNAAYLARLDCRGQTMTVDYKEKSALGYTEQEIHSLPFLLKNYSKAAFLGSGLGMDLIRADYFGIPNKSAFEINPYLISLERELLGEKSHYQKPGVSLYLGDARRGVATSNKKFDLIYISSSKNYGRVGINTSAILLNRVLTLEAIRTYWSKLTEDGVLFLVDNDAHTPKVQSNLRVILDENGLSDGGHVFQGEDGFGYAAFLLSKKPIPEEQRRGLSDAMERRNLRMTLAGLGEIAKTITDDRPNMVNLTVKTSGGFAVYTFLAVLLTVALIAWPLLDSEPGGRQVSSDLFALAGSGVIFISVQIALMYSLELLFDHPVLTVALILIAMLAASGAGSLVSAKLSRNQTLAARFILLVLLGLAAWKLHDAVQSFYVASLALRTGLALIAVVPIAMALGTVFPFHISNLKRIAPHSVALGIGVNGMGTLIGGAMATWVIAGFGISSVYAVAAIITTGLIFCGKRR